MIRSADRRRYPERRALGRVMAVFMLNICKFNDCGIRFQSLGDLIQHIEDNHIDYDPLVIKEKELEQPSCLHLSYVLRFFTDAARKDVVSVKPKPEIPKLPVRTTNSTTVSPTGSCDEEEITISEFEDSNDSWTATEEYSSEFILKYGSKASSPTTLPDGTVIDKPFACPVPGCNKRYKNVNGIKYHSKNGHKNEGRIRKAFKCFCGKSYRSNGGLKNHTAVVHQGAAMTQLTSSNSPQVLQVPSLQPVRTLSIKNIGSLGVPLKTLVVTTKPCNQNGSYNLVLTPKVPEQSPS